MTRRRTDLPFFWLPFAPIVVAVLIVMLAVGCGSEPTGPELAESAPAPRCTVIRFLFPPSYERVLEVRLCAE